MEELFMREAISQAKNANWPFGAVIVKDGKILAQAGSGDGQDLSFDPTAHAEVNAIRRACEKLQTGDLSGAIMYTSCEPCALCVGAIWYAGIKEVVFGSSLCDIAKTSAAWGGDLGYPQDYIHETGIKIRGGFLKEEVMEMFNSHPRINKINN